MPATAYKNGQLKKNPLLGTATNTVANRADQKGRLLGLYGEAKTMAGQGRTGMQGVLAGRHARSGAEDQAALGDLTNRYQDLQNQAANVRNEDAKKKFFKDHPNPDAVKQQEAYEDDVATKVQAMEDEGSTYAAEYNRRNHALQQRIDDYNLFLGTY